MGGYVTDNISHINGNSSSINGNSSSINGCHIVNFYNVNNEQEWVRECFKVCLLIPFISLGH
jgi:hypothetical protein